MRSGQVPVVPGKEAALAGTFSLDHAAITIYYLVTFSTTQRYITIKENPVWQAGQKPQRLQDGPDEA